MDKTLIEQGNACYTKKDYKSAITFFSQAIEVSPTAANYGHRAVAYMAGKDYLTALEDNNISVEADPKYVKGYLRAAQCYCAVSDYASAIDAYEVVLKMKPKNKTAKEAIKKLKELLDIMPNAERAIKYGNLQPAYNMLTKAIQIDPNNLYIAPELLYKRAGVLLRLHKITDAIEDTFLATDIDEHCLQALQKRATLFSKLELFEDTVECLETLWNIDPSPENTRMLNDARKNCKSASSCYSILDVEHTATKDEIKKAYHKLSLQYHPDKHSESSEAIQVEAENKMKDINMAYEVLSDPETRKRYDARREPDVKVERYKRSKRKHEHLLCDCGCGSNKYMCSSWLRRQKTMMKFEKYIV